MTTHREQLQREQAAAALVAGWFGTNPGRLERYTIERARVGDRIEHVATVTLRTTLTAGEVAEYAATVAGGDVAAAIRTAVRTERERDEFDPLDLP